MKNAILFGGMAAMLIFAGCQDTVNTTENADKSMRVHAVGESRFITDRFLRDRLVIRLVNTSRTADGFLRVQVAAENARTGFFSELWSGITGENPYKIRYKFVWFNSDGMAVDSVLSDWQDATVMPGETLYLQSVAPDKSCNDFKVSLKESN
ncbi:MAG: YcfL family protein [Lentisphaeria bacterium]|nr:YcfL family protein [Lentisphaeria bacterium]